MEYQSATKMKEILPIATTWMDRRGCRGEGGRQRETDRQTETKTERERDGDQTGGCYRREDR